MSFKLKLTLISVLYLISLVSSACVDDLVQCSDNLTSLQTEYQTLQSEYESCGCNADPCSEVPTIEDYNEGLHIASVFIILFASLLGTLIPLGSHYFSINSLGYFIGLGKSMGVGVIISCGFIHMLVPSVESLESECVPESFRESFPAYPYLFAIISIMLMHLMDFLVLDYIVEKAKSKHSSKNADVELSSSTMSVSGHDHHGSHGHSHLIPYEYDGSIIKAIEAYSLEFGLTVHSIFVGLAVGVSDAETLKALLVALCFHQFFEGISLGSRVIDASLSSKIHDFILVAIFSISAPLGIAIGIGIVNSLNVEGATFLLVQGIFDGFCAGILIYIGFSLLFKDFQEDITNLCKGKPNEKWRKLGLFVALYCGAGFMSLIGKFL